MDFFISLFSTPAVLLGLVALVGLKLQKKSGTQVMEGTFKTIIGFLVFGLGGSAISGTLQNFNALFQYGFNIQGVVAVPEAAIALVESQFGLAVASILILGFVMNLVFARITPFKNIFFHGGHSLFFAAVLTLVFKAHGYSTATTIIAGGTILGFMAAFLPAVAQPFTRKVTGNDDLAIGHYNLFAYALAGKVGTIFSKHKEKSTEAINFPKWLSFFKDFLISSTVVMLILFYVAALVAGREFTQEIAGNTHWLVFPLLQAFTFSAGMYVLFAGVRMFLAEIQAAFVAISDKIIPNSRPALDVPTIFPYAPTAVVIGFVSAYAAGLIAMVTMIGFDFPIIIIPAAHIAFFSGGTAAIYGNATGGWRGAVLGSFLTGLLLAFLPVLLFPVLNQMIPDAGATFPNVDMNIIGWLLDRIFGIFN